MNKISRVKVEALIKTTKGHFFGATFTKKDKSMRVINARLGVTANLKGGKNTVVKQSNSYITVYDTHKRAYRTLNLATVTNLSINGSKYKVVD